MKLKHCFQRLAAAMACLMLCVLCMPTALAKGYVQLTDAQMGQTCSITLSYRVNSAPVEGVQFRLYRVASMNKEVRLELSGEFAALQPLANADPNDLPGSLSTTWAALAETLYQNLDDTMVPAATVSTNADGIARAEGLSLGLYLVVGDRHAAGTPYEADETYYRPAPFLISLPSWTEPEGAEPYWAFDVDVTAKPMASMTARKVLKVWTTAEGGTVPEDQIPTSITVELLRNGAVYNTATLSDANNWRADFGELSGSDSWTLRETTELGERYTVSVEQRGLTFVLTNTYTPPVTPPPGPLTPETSPSPSPSPSVNPAPDPSPSPVTPPEEVEDPAVPMDPGPADLPNVEEVEEPEVPLGQPDPEEEEIPEEGVPMDKLPQTGQLWWPVPALAVSGTVMVFSGAVRRKNGSTDDAE